MSVFQPGNTAVITGGADGIGLALAARCLSSGMRVLLVDCDESALTLASASLSASASASASTSSVASVCVDVGRLEDWSRVSAAVDAHLGGAVHLLALNAGVGGPSPWTDVAAFRRIWDVNLYGVLHGISTLLPVVEKTPAAAAIVITGSKQGITNPPGTSPAYNASKAAIKSLAEQLSFDLVQRAPHVSVHLLIPGWTHTTLTGARPDQPKPAGAWSPAQVIDHLVPAMAAGRFYILCPDNEVTEAMDRQRVLWSAGDVVHDRPALSRWRPEFQEAWKASSQ